MTGLPPINPHAAGAENFLPDGEIIGVRGSNPARVVQGEEAVIEPTRLLYVLGLAALFLPTTLITVMDFSSGHFKMIYPAVMTLIFSPLILRTFWLVNNLPSLRLSVEGVTIPGGWIRKPKLLRWDEIEEFGVYLSFTQQLSWDPGPLMRVGYNYRPDAEPKFNLFDMPAWGSRQHVVPSFYALEPDSAVERLNACRELMLAQAERSSS